MINTKDPLIFIIEESIIYKDLIVGHLQHKYKKIKTFNNAEECQKYLNQHPDIIILDYSLEGTSGLEFMKKVKEMHHAIDFIFLSGQNDVEVAISIMKLGASDYVVKNEKAPARLVKAIEQAIHTKKKENLNKGFTMGVFGFFLVLMLVIAAIIASVLLFKLG